jgi:tetratricopeptide (TPR) repeat protein
MRSVLLAIVLLTATARAEQLPARAAAEAKAQYDKGVVAYNLQKFDDAIAAFTRAYEIDPSPILLFNIAQSHNKKGETERALFYYRRYLEADPAAENRDKVEARIRELEAASKPKPPAPLPAVSIPPPAGERTAPPVAVVERPLPAPAPERPPLYRRPWFWGAAAGVVAASVAAFFLLRPGERTWDCGTKCVRTAVVP